MKIYLVRHGEYLSSDMNADQSLSEKGRKETADIAHLLKEMNFEISEIRHSVKKRAKDTAEILFEAIDSNSKLIQTEGLKPSDPIEPLLEEILAADNNLMVVGHLPYLEKLLTVLLFGEERESPVDLCNSCVICLEGEKRDWKIAWMISPKCFSTRIASQ